MAEFISMWKTKARKVPFQAISFGWAVLTDVGKCKPHGCICQADS